MVDGEMWSRGYAVKEMRDAARDADHIGDKDFALHEYTAASVQNCFVHMYQWVSSIPALDCP
jgi:hypothetical protein